MAQTQQQPQRIHPTTPAVTLRLFGLLLLAGFAVACATSADRLDILNRTLFAYEHNIRWSQFDAAFGFHIWENGTSPPNLESLEKIRVTGYDVEKRVFNEEAMTTNQTVLIRYYNTDTSREKTIRVTQDWRYDEEKKTWKLHSPPPRFE